MHIFLSSILESIAPPIYFCTMSLVLPPLSYDLSALEPHISTQSMIVHQKQHLGQNVGKVNKMIAGTGLEKIDLTTIVRAAKEMNQDALFNAASQLWNHNFFFHCMKPHGGGAPRGKVSDLINQHFGSYTQFREVFENAANDLFGSGYVWLIWSNGELKVQTTKNADSPLCAESGNVPYYKSAAAHHIPVPIIAIDMWEHAYYLDFKNDKARYISVFLGSLVNWDFANKQLE